MGEQLKLGSQKQDAGHLKAALVNFQAAGHGLLAVSGEHSSTIQASRGARAAVLSQWGRNEGALALVQHVDPIAYRANIPDPGRGAVLQTC